jgi:hypothetical protein
MMPYDTYRIYQVDRDKSLAGVRQADEQAARFASAVSWLLGGITRPVRAIWRTRTGPDHPACPARPNWLARRAAKPAPQRDAAGGLT